VPAGFAVYLLINWSVSGDPFVFLQARKRLFDQSFALPLTRIRQAIWAHYPTPHEAEMVGTQEPFFVASVLSARSLVGSSCVRLRHVGGWVLDSFREC
jgi:hypothetical protein